MIHREIENLTGSEAENEQENLPETQAQPEKRGIADRIRETKAQLISKFAGLVETLKNDARLNEEMFAKLEPQMEDNRRLTIDQLHGDTLALLKKTEDTEKYYGEELEELERLSAIKAEDYSEITAEQFLAMPAVEQRILKGLRVFDQRIKDTEDPDELIAWAEVAAPYDRKYLDAVEQKMQAQAVKDYGSQSAKNNPWQLLSYEPYEKFKLAMGSGAEKSQAIFRREANDQMDADKATEFFKSQFKDGNYRGSLHLLGNYLSHVPEESRDKELVGQAKEGLAKGYWSTANGNEGYEQLLDQMENPKSAASRSLHALWKGDMDIMPFGQTAHEFSSKELALTGRMREILASPERGPQYLDYFTNKCGIKNLDRFSMELLDKVYQEKDDTEKPYGLLLLATADNNGVFSKDGERYDEFIDSLSQSGYRLLLAEAGSDREALKAIQNAYSRQSGNRIGFIVVGGHGTPDSIQFGNHENVFKTTPGRNASLEKEDDTHIRMTIRASRKYIEPGAEVLAISCSTGMKNEISTSPIMEEAARRTGLVTKGMSKPLGISKLSSHIKPDGKIGLDMEVFEGVGRRPHDLDPAVVSRTPAKVNTFEFKNFKAEDYDYLAKSGKK